MEPVVEQSRSVVEPCSRRGWASRSCVPRDVSDRVHHDAMAQANAVAYVYQQISHVPVESLLPEGKVATVEELALGPEVQPVSVPMVAVVVQEPEARQEEHQEEVHQ